VAAPSLLNHDHAMI
jgi:hypothetical protein